MTGLRDRKKQQVRSRIVAAANELFAANGLEATTVEDVANGADVSVATVYNYFGSKNALFLAGAADNTEIMLERGRSVLARPGTNPSKAVRRLLATYLEEFIAWEPALLREVMRATFGREGSMLTAELARLDQRLIDQLVALLESFHERGRLRPGVDPYQASVLLFSILVTQLFMFVAMEGQNHTTSVEQIDRQVEMAFAGLAAQPIEKAK